VPSPLDALSMGEPIKTEQGFVASPFTRLARTHGLMVGGDTLVAVALAGSLFFDITPDAARWRIALYLLLTVAPFAVVAPMVGPALDRMKGGRRMLLIASAVGRAVVCAIMIRDVDTLLLFPEAFLLLVFSKSYSISKAALVPSVVHNDSELLEANAKLTLIGAIVGFIVMVPAVPLLKLGGPEWVLGLGSIVFVAATVVAFQIKKTTIAEAPAGPQEKAELHSAGIVLAGSAMAVVRGIVGFLTFVVAFYIRNAGSSEFWFAIVLAASGFGALLGAVLTPRLRQAWREENILISVLLLVMVTGIAAAASGSRLFAATAAALVVGLGASGGKLAFDSIVQRDAPDANRGRSFAKFETRFQLAWVVGAFIPVIVPIPLQAGLLALSLAGGAAGASYYASLRYLRANGKAPEPLLKRVGVTAAVKAGWDKQKQRRATPPGDGQAFDELPPPVAELPVGDATAPVAVTPPVVPLGGKRERATLPPPGQEELPLEPPVR
jgi:predicted MFS family arabinose efflux permease